MDGHEGTESGNMYSTLAVRGETETLNMVKRSKRQQNSVGWWCFLCNESLIRDLKTCLHVHSSKCIFLSFVP